MLTLNSRLRWRFRDLHIIELLAALDTRYTWLAVPVLALPAVLPFWSGGFPETADGHLHLLRLVLLDRYLGQGWLYPRWLPDLVLGRGYPVFNFYAPATYYFAEGLHLLGLGYQHALASTFALLILLAGIGMFLTARDIIGPSRPGAALLAATAYMYAPYLVANTFVRAAVGEVGAQALLPWIFWATYRLVAGSEPRRYVVPAALVMAGLAVTHNITSMFLPPVWLAYVLVLWWQAGRRRGALLWAGAAAVLAMLLSAFFWLPMAVERTYLSDAVYKISARILPENVWTWRDFLNWDFYYKYGYGVPYRLGLVQLALALAGFVLARRKDAVWLFFAFLALAAGLAIGRWTLPIWLQVEPLPIVQFPWRLLSILSVPLALFTGGIILCLRQRWMQVLVTLGLLALVIIAQRPNPAWVTSMALDSVPFGPASEAQFEADSGALGTSKGEFLPDWVKNTHFQDAESLGEHDTQVALQAANAFDLSVQVNGADGGPLRINTFYYPGWKAVLDDQQTVRTFPSTNLGLLTVDIPRGTHHLSLRWQGTPLARTANALSLLALLAAVLWCLKVRPMRWLALPLVILFAICGVGTFYHPSLNSVAVPTANVGTDSFRLLGYQLEPDDGQHVLIRPFWYTTNTPPGNLRVRWQLLDRTGQVLSQVEGTPYYDTLSTGDWPAATIVRDAYRLPLPSRIAAGSYQLAAQIESPDTGPIAAPAIVGTADLPAGKSTEARPAVPLDVHFGETIQLRGYGLLVNDRPVSLSETRPPAVHPGDKLEYLLYWQASGPIRTNYHGFVHMLDQSGQALTKRDQAAGSIYAMSTSWDSTRPQPDHYRLIIPAATAGGLYRPAVGLYDVRTLARLPVKTNEAGPDAFDYRLPPIKVAGRSADIPQHAESARFGDLARLTGYTVEAPAQLHPGDNFQVTLYYEAQTNAGQNLTRFVHLDNPDLGMAAQQDGIPQDGQNPTWSWIPGEQIRETVQLSVAPDSRPGQYKLAVGLYDTQNNGARVAALDKVGQPLPDSQVTLTELTVTPAE